MCKVTKVTQWDFDYCELKRFGDLRPFSVVQLEPHAMETYIKTTVFVDDEEGQPNALFFTDTTLYPTRIDDDTKVWFFPNQYLQID